jgi:hypothetical protein
MGLNYGFAVDKPSVFIGSSVEGLRIAEALFACMSHETRPKLWTHQLFLPGDYPMEALEKQLRRHDFAILVASSDDQVVKRGVSAAAMRDNLLLEFGLFAGVLGRRRAFFVFPSTPQIELPSDLFGIVQAQYDADRVSSGPDEVAAAVQVPCQQIRSVVADEWSLIQRGRAETATGLAASQKGQAIKRLHGVAAQLRDTLVVVQRDALAAFSNEQEFKLAKERAVAKVNEISKSFEIDARIAGAEDELKVLAKTTATALGELPFPNELSMGRQGAQRRAVDTALGAFDAWRSGSDPVRHVESVAADEAKARMASLRDRYSAWWDQHCPLIQASSAKLLDALFNAAMDVAASASHGGGPAAT